ncbi:MULTISPECIES: hypothetical protein [Mycolicibacterium]|uniref:hypothetical protein n=1 Tax=Mycolicibacterium TaxID=1866885 RepID=UPI00103FA598|nr:MULTISPECIES: hypothetical protein [Mycolicibacterium]
MATLNSPRQTTVRQLFALSMNRCAFPSCSTPIVMPDSGTIVGEVCHIRAQNPEGPRYDSNQSDEERHGFENLVLMCGVHHKIIDARENAQTYTVEALIEIKSSHEQAARESGDIPDAPPSVIAALTLTATVYESGATHMDFSNAVFKVGGEGGLLAGQGGQGGVLKIVGMSLPPSVIEEMGIDGRGGDGRAPGAGGGGGGAIIFEGRSATNSDIADGLKVPLFFPASSCESNPNGLLYALGFGWSHCGVLGLPWEIRLDIGALVEVGTIEANTLLRLEITARDPSGADLALGTVDVPVHTTRDLINRTAISRSVNLVAQSEGIYELGIRSGEFDLARFPFEVRLMTEPPRNTLS